MNIKMMFRLNICKWLSLGLLAITTQLTYGADCVPQAEMQIIAQSFNQFRNLANGDYCYDGSQTSNLVQALEFMRQTKYPSSMANSSDDLFSGYFAQNWWGYFTGRIADLVVQNDCPKGMGAYVYGFGTSMYVCPMLLTDSFTALDRVSVMMHEARHMDGFPHITCQNGPRAGVRGACDQKMSDKGSYDVTVETYAQLGAYAVALHPALRAYARNAAVIYGDEAFEIPARINRTSQFLLLTQNKQFYRLPADGTGQLKQLGSAPSLGRLVKKSQQMILFPDDKNLPAKYVFANDEGDIQQQAGDLIVEYNNQSPAQRADFVDMHWSMQWSARIYHNHILFMCDPTSPAIQDLDLAGLTPVTTLYPNGYDRSVGSVEVLIQSGAILEVGCNRRTAFVRPSPRVLDQAYKRIYKSGNEVLGVTTAGRLYQIQGTTSTPLMTKIDGQIYEIAPNESFAFFDSLRDYLF